MNQGNAIAPFMIDFSQEDNFDLRNPFDKKIDGLVLRRSCAVLCAIDFDHVQSGRLCTLKWWQISSKAARDTVQWILLN